MAGVLTVNLVMQKAKVDDIYRVQKLNVCAAQLQDIGVLRNAANLQILSLSLNEITDLGPLSRCSRLREVYLRRNQIRDINQVLHLTRLPYLEVLNLSDNPIARDPNYRHFVIAAVPSLTRLDDVDITDEERVAAVRIFPELTRFAPPSSPYADPNDGRTPLPTTPQPAQQPQGGGGGAGNAYRVQGRPANPSRQRPREPSTEMAGTAAYHPNSLGGGGGNGYGANARRRPGSNGGMTTPQKTSVPSHVVGAGGQGRHGGSNAGGYSPQARTSVRSSVSATNGPTESGVVQAVKVLCAELSPHGMDEVRRFLDSMRAY